MYPFVKHRDTLCIMMCYIGILMAQITLRVDDELLDRIEAATDEETSRSEWLREAARDRLDEDDGDVTDRLDEIEQRLSQLEAEQPRPFYQRLFGK